MNHGKTRCEVSQKQDENRGGGSLPGVALVLTLCATVSGCQQGPDPLQRAFDGIGGQVALLDLRGFSYESSGDRFEAAQGLRPTGDPIKASSFTLDLQYDLENDRLSFDWQRQIFDPLRGQLSYRDVLDGEIGYQTGNDSVLNPPSARSDRPLPSGRIGAVRREFRLLNPQLALRAAAVNPEAVTIKGDVELNGRIHHVIEVSGEVQPVELFVDAESGQVSKLQTVQNDHIWGDVLTLPNGDQDQTLVTATAVASDPDVQHLSGGSHHSLAVKLSDGIVVVESPLNQARSKAVLNKLDELWPSVSVSHLFLTHHHFDHMGGIRTYAAAGVTIVTSELNSSFVEEALASSHTLVPDALAEVASPEWHIEAVPVGDEFSLTEGGRSVKARHVPTIHNEDMLVIYVPEIQLLFESDVYIAGVFPPHQPLPAPCRDWARWLLDGLAPL